MHPPLCAATPNELQTLPGTHQVYLEVWGSAAYTQHHKKKAKRSFKERCPHSVISSTQTLWKEAASTPRPPPPTTSLISVHELHNVTEPVTLTMTHPTSCEQIPLQSVRGRNAFSPEADLRPLSVTSVTFEWVWTLLYVFTSSVESKTLLWVLQVCVDASGLELSSTAGVALQQSDDGGVTLGSFDELLQRQLA